MNDKKLRRLFTVTWFLLGLVLAGIIYMYFVVSGHEQQPVINNYVGQRGQKGETVVGPRGDVGPIGPQGLQAAPTQPTVIENQTTITQPAIQGPQGDKGEPGEKGDPGVGIQIQVNPLTKDLEYRYDGDTFWNILIPCSELIKSCEAP